MATSTQPQPEPTAKQLAFLRRLAHQTGTTFTLPRTRRQASRQIAALLARPVSSQLEFAPSTTSPSAAASCSRPPDMPALDPPTPASYANALTYEHTDIPPGLTLTDWRRQRARQAGRAHAAERSAHRRVLFAALTLRATRHRTPPTGAPQTRAVAS